MGEKKKVFADKMSQFSLLPEEILLQIFSFLSGRDILILSRVSSFLFNLLKNEHIWKKILDKEHLSISKHVEKLSKLMEGLSSLPPSKLHYMAVQKLHKRWVTGSSQKSSLVISYNRPDTHFRKSDNFLAFVDPDQSIKLYDLTSPEPSLLSNWNLNSERKISIMFVLKSYLVIGYFDDFSLSLRTYSLQSFTLLWEEQNIIDCRNLMRSYHQDMYNFEDIIAVFRSGSISLYSVGDTSSKHLRVKQDIAVQDGIFQYPRFSSFSERHYVHPFQVFPTSLHDQAHEQVQVKHRIYCWSLSDQDNITVKTLTMGTPVDPHSIFIMTGVSSSHCYGLHGSTLVSWSLSTGDLVSQAYLSVPGHMMCVGDIDVMAGVCSLLLARQGSTVQRSYIGIFSFTGALLGKIVIQGEHFSITNIYIYNKKIVLERKVLGSKTVSVLVADLSSVFENLDREEEVMVEPIEVFKWEKTESTKGDLIVSESSIVQYSESEAVGNIEINEIAVHSFWHNELIK